MSGPVNNAGGMGARIRRVYQHLSAGMPFGVLLEGMDPLPGTVGEMPRVNGWSVMGLRPRRVLRLSEEHRLVVDEERSVPVDSAADLFRQLRSHSERCLRHQVPDVALPLSGGWLGVLGYGFSRWCDPALYPLFSRGDSPSAWPDLLLVEFEDLLLVNRQSGALQVLSPSQQRRRSYEEAWHSLEPEPVQGIDDASVTPDYLAGFAASLSPETFALAVDRLKGAIRRGEVYQANLTLRLARQLRLEPAAVYDALSARNPSPFAGVMHWPEGRLLSNSPERLVCMNAQGHVETRPIAGTRGRGKDEAADRQIGEKLLANEKERAEHLMLVDLLRNDLGRVCRAGSVTVDELLTLERYSHVTHLVSNVTGALRPGYDAWEVLRAVFPGGTITGCPKIRCMAHLQKLEPVPRGLYTGSLGYLDPMTGAMDFNILIRTLFLEETPTPLVYNGAVHVGAGIVADSVAAHEYRECQRKAAAILGVLQAHESASRSSAQHCL